jgi:hypothetical protein
MAHRGKDWPVVFRRDFNLNSQTYRHGLANRYDVGTQAFTFPDYPELQNTVWDCGPGTLEPPARLAWLSNVRVLAGRSWQFRFYGTLSGAALEFFTPSWELWLNGAKILAYALRAPDHNSDVPINGLGGSITFQDPTKFPHGPGSVGFVTVSPVHYP